MLMFSLDRAAALLLAAAPDASPEERAWADRYMAAEAEASELYYELLGAGVPRVVRVFDCDRLVAGAMGLAVGQVHAIERRCAEHWRVLRDAMPLVAAAADDGVPF